jgi:release factor glutamine methyltransferase
MPSVEMLATEVANKLMGTYNDYILCNQYAWWLLEALTQQNKALLIEQTGFELTQNQQRILAEWIKKLTEQHCPLQYLLGTVPFCDIDIIVEPPVLIPRPETEEWTAALIKKLKSLHNKNLKILDLCTGSGCIALAIAKALPQAKIVASDIQDHALGLAERNRTHNSIFNIAIFKSDLFASIPQAFKFDIIVGNPPYIAAEEWPDLDPSVKNWEDKQALVATDHGLKIIADIIHQAPAFLRSNEELETEKVPQLVIEIGFRQGGRVAALLEKEGYCNIVIEKDLEGKDRIACARVVPCGYINKQ